VPKIKSTAVEELVLEPEWEQKLVPVLVSELAFHRRVPQVSPLRPGNRGISASLKSGITAR
jgi:hypothetical protein